MNLAARVIGSILKHDKKVNSYKIALVRAVNDVVLSYPDLVDANLEVAVPLRRLAQQWLGYYWPFMDPNSPVLQGPRAKRRGVMGNDVAFRPALTRLRIAWADHFSPLRPSDGFLAVAELQVPRIALRAIRQHCAGASKRLGLHRFLATPARSSPKASRSVSSHNRVPKAAKVFAASYFLRQGKLGELDEKEQVGSLSRPHAPLV